MRRKKLADILKLTADELEAAIKSLEAKLAGRGITLQFIDDEVALKTAPAVSSLIEELTKEELTRDLGKAGLETLAIVLYRGPISRREIDYIRGVNSAFIVRNLLVRGLIEKVPSSKDERVFLYKTTFELLSYLGVSRESDMPEFDAVRSEIKAFEAAAANAEPQQQHEQ